jgi:glycosyltransferase involved in cell wall biosynthesis
MPDLRFSIVVPTRNRAKTLRFALHTCLAQRFDSFEVIVADNCSSSDTKQVVDSMGSDRIKYVRSEKPLAMSDNWELAVSKASGEYVIVIGDDDGLLSNALGQIDRLLEHFKVRILRSEHIIYFWPDVPIEQRANLIWLPVPKDNRLIDSNRAISAVVNGGADYRILPMFYNAAVHRDLIAELRKRTGRVFKSRSPDVYSGVALAYLSKSYYSIGKPWVIMGISGTSNGIAQLYQRGPSPIVQDFNALNQASGFLLHPHVPDVPALPALVANEFIWAKEYLFPRESRLRLDRKKLAENYVRYLENFDDPDEKWNEHLLSIRSSLQDNRRLCRWFERRYMVGYQRRRRKDLRPFSSPGFYSNLICLSGEDFGASDVSGVAALCEKILGGQTSLRVNTRNEIILRDLREVGRVLLRGL